MKILVTGGAGFIGSAIVRLLCKLKHRVVVIDKLTYAGDIKRIDKCKVQLYKVDIRNRNKIDEIFKKEIPDCVINASAESSVDKSIENSTPFIETNILGTQVLLDASRKNKTKRFIHMSTDEVYGENLNGAFTETDELNPSNPYSASKAGADCLIKSYIRTYRLPAIIVRPCNNYGPYQHVEKFIPKTIRRIKRHRPITIHGTGSEKREWIYVDDCAKAIYHVMTHGKIGEIYNIGSGEERTNISVVDFISHTLLIPWSMDSSVQRPGQDRRYFLNSDKIQSIGWKPEIRFSDGMYRLIKDLS